MNAFLEKARTGNNSWFLYVITILVVFLATQLGGIPLMIYSGIKSPDLLAMGMVDPDIMKTNIGLFFALIPYAVGFFTLLLCAKYIHKKSVLDIISGRNRYDWRRMGFGALLWTVLLILSNLVAILADDSSQIVFRFDPIQFFVLVIISLSLLPLQTAFEEILFRGYLMQGSWLVCKSKWAALILTSLLFGALHLANPEIEEFGLWVAMPQYILMGLFLGYITLKDNGLELAIGIHAANNIIASVTITSDASALQTHALFKNLNPTASHWDSVIILITAFIFIYIANKKYRFIKNKPLSL